MSNRKYSRLAEGYHDRSQYHPYQTGSKYSAKNHTNCVSDSRNRSPSSGSGSRGSSPYSSRHSNNSPRLIRSKSTHSRSRDVGKKGSSKSPSDSVTHSRHSNNSSHGTDHHGKFNHVNNDFPWSQHTSSSGKQYYYNCKTEKSQWEKPKEWIERENREKERKERERRELLLSREPKHSNGSREYGYTTRDTDLSRNANLSKLSRSGTSKGQKEYSSPKDGRERRADTHQLESRMHCYSDNRKKDYNSPSSMYISDGRGHSVVKTSSANTVALSTNTHRSTPVAALPGGEETVSPAGSVQDVSPPSTPSSHPGSLEHMSHSSSPQLPTLSPLVAQFHSSQSPHLQLPQSQVQPYSTRQPTLPGQNVLSQSAMSGCPVTVPAQYSYSSQQSFIPQMRPVTSNLGQYSLVNKAVQPLQQHKQQPVSYRSSSVQAATASPQPCQTSFDNQVRQPVLHPLQQATLLQQRQLLSEVEHHQQTSGLNYDTSYSSAQTLVSHHHSVVPAVTHPTAMPLPGSAVHHAKEPELNTHNASSSPSVFSHSSVATKEHAPPQVPLPPLAPISNSQPHPGSSLPVPSQPSPPAVNLQSLAKYTDKSVINIASGWPSEVIEKQVQRCWDDSTCYLSECAKTSSEHLEMLSQLSFMELRLDVGAKRISQLKEMTKTLEVLLEGSDAKSLM